MTPQDETKIKEDKEAITKAITEAVVKFFIKDIENIFVAARQKVNEPDEEIDIYEKLCPGEVMILSRSKKGFLIAANDGEEFDIRYYSEEQT